MRLDHLLSKEEEVEEREALFNYEGSWSASEKMCEKTQEEFPVAMRLGDTPVPIPNTMVKTQTADGTILETVWESRWLPDSSKWGCSSVGRAPALQAGGQGFESLHLHSDVIVKSV